VEGESLSLQDVDGVFLHVPTSRDIVKRKTLLSDHGASISSLIMGSLPISPASSDDETSNVVFDTLLYQEEGEFSMGEENLENILKHITWHYKSQSKA